MQMFREIWKCRWYKIDETDNVIRTAGDADIHIAWQWFKIHENNAQERETL